MAKKKAKGAVRLGGQRVEVYNEGLCVYLYDEGNSERLRTLIAKKGDPDEVFHSNLSDPAFAKAVAKDGLAVSYELYQDDEVLVDVFVGPPLSDEELSASRWLPVQRARLNLRSGRLRIDTPNTMPLDPETPDSPGGEVATPSGDYVLSLYRVDHQACTREGIKHAGPSEVIVLTPKAEAAPLKAGSPILEYPEPPEETGWIGAYKVQGKKFECRVNFWDFWDWLNINLEADAVKKLGLTCGSVVRLQAAGRDFDLIYIDRMPLEAYLAQVGRAALDKGLGERAEVGIGGWHEKGEREVLGFARYRNAEAVPEKYHETWTPAAGEVLSESFPPPPAVTLAPARRKGKAVRAFVALANDDLLVINVTAADMPEGCGTMKLTLPHGVHTVAVGAPDLQNLATFLTGKGIPSGLYYLNLMGLRSFARERKVPKKSDEYNVEVLPAAERRPVSGLIPTPTGDPMSRFLNVTPMMVDGEPAGFDWPEPPAAGTAVTLTWS